MDFLELARERYSCRNFSTKEVEKEKIEKVLEAGRLAPTARNFQPQRMLVLKDKKELEKLNNCTQFGWNAPVIIIAFYDKTASGKRTKYDNKDYGETDTSIAVTHMILEAQNLGLGTTWIGSFDPKELTKTYEVPDKLIPIAILALGYPAEDSKPSDLHFKRNELEQFVYWNKLNVTNKNNA